jgi:hypothetical protein
MKHGCDEPDKKNFENQTYSWVTNRSPCLSNSFKNTGKTPKSSVPVLSAVKPWFSQGFSHFLPIALAFLPIHACPCLQVLRRLVRCLGPW